MNVVKATPRRYLSGIKDDSQRTVTAAASTAPQWLALCPLFTQKGDGEERIVTKSTFDKIYGADSLKEDSVYFTHQSVLANDLFAAGGQVMVKSLPTPGDQAAEINLYVELVPFSSNNYHLLWHNIQYPGWIDDNSNEVVPEAYPDKVLDFRDVDLSDGDDTLHPDYVSNGGGLGGFTPVSSSSLIHIASIQISSAGVHGNDYAIRLKTFDDSSNDRNVQVQLSRRLGHRVYSLELIRKDPFTGTTTIVPNKFGEPSSNVVLAPNVYHPDLNTELSIDEVLRYAWSDSDSIDLDSNPIGNVDINYANLTSLRAGLSVPVQSVPTGSFDDPFIDSFALVDDQDNAVPGLMDIVTGKAFPGEPPLLFTVDQRLKFDAVHWFWGAAMRFMGGVKPLLELKDFINSGLDWGYSEQYDALMEQYRIEQNEDLIRQAYLDSDMLPLGPEARDLARFTTYEFSVYDYLQQVLYTDFKYKDQAYYPFRDFVDSGFSYAVKDLIVALPGLRKDINVYAATFALVPYLPSGSTPVSSTGGLPAPLVSIVRDDGDFSDTGIVEIKFTDPQANLLEWEEYFRANDEISTEYRYKYSLEIDSSGQVYVFEYGSLERMSEFNLINELAILRDINNKVTGIRILDDYWNAPDAFGSQLLVTATQSIIDTSSFNIIETSPVGSDTKVVNILTPLTEVPSGAFLSSRGSRVIAM